MKTILIIEGREVKLEHAVALSSGHGHKEIIVEISYNGQGQKFKSTTDDMLGYDIATEIENSIEYYYALYKLIKHKIVDKIVGWIENIETESKGE
jgi:hypothetical protein